MHDAMRGTTGHTLTSPAKRSVRVMRAWLLPLAAAAFVSALYLVPQLVYSAKGNSGALLVTSDETMYVTRMVRGLQGLPAMSPFIYEHRNDLSLVSGIAESALAQPFRLGVLLGFRPMAVASAMIVVYRGLLAFLSVLSFVWALQASGFSRQLATLAALWIFLDPGILSYKPIVGFSFVNYNLNRLTNPLLGFPIFCVAWGCLAQAMLRDRQRRTFAVLAGVALGLCFYANFYYWTFLCGVVAMTTLLSPRRRLPVALIVGVVAALVAIEYFRYALSLRSQSQYFDILWRTDFRQLSRGVAFVPNSTQWIVLLGALALWHLAGTVEGRYYASAVAGGIAVYYSALVTGLQMPSSLESSHWNYALAPVASAGCLWSGLIWLRRTRWAEYENRLLATFAVFLVLGGCINIARLTGSLLTLQANGSGLLSSAYEPAWRFLDEHTPSDVVVLASEQTQAFEPVKAGKYVWCHFHAYPDPVSFEEMLDRYRVQWALSGWGPSELQRYFDRWDFGRDTWFWGWGLTHELAEELRRDDWPQLDRMRWRAFTKMATELLGRTTPRDLKAIGSRYRLDYIVRGPNERDFIALEEVFELEPVFQTAEVRVDRVVRWR